MTRHLEIIFVEGGFTAPPNQKPKMNCLHSLVPLFSSFAFAEHSSVKKKTGEPIRTAGRRHPAVETSFQLTEGQYYFKIAPGVNAGR
jgi:hypothetical protein